MKATGGNGPVFIVGMNGSGTTMLSDCLGKHPELYMFPRETRILPFYISKVKTYGDLSKLAARRRLADDLGSCFAFWRENNNKPVFLDDKYLDRPNFSEIANNIYMHFAAFQGKFRWGEKTPMYLQHIHLLSTHFPNSRFIHIYRDGRDVAQSVHRRWKLEPRRTIYRWKKILDKGRHQGLALGPSRYMEIRYETLTADPVRQFKKICGFLNLAFHIEVLTPSMRQMDPKIKSRSIVRNTGKWKGYFSKRQIHEMEKIGGRLLSELGYEIVSSAGDKNASRVQLRVWWLHDRIVALLHQLKKSTATSPAATLKKIIALLRQSRANYH